MKRIDPTAGMKALYTASPHVREVVAERGVFLCTVGRGEPGDAAFREAADRLKAVCGAVRAHLRKSRGMDFRMPRLEIRWMTDPLDTRTQERHWRLMLRLPDEVTQAHLRQARETLRQKSQAGAERVTRISWREGRALQVLHAGADDSSREESFAKLQARAGEAGYRVKGPGHEIYLRNPERTDPASWKRILRLPIAWPRPPYAHGRPEENGR